MARRKSPLQHQLLLLWKHELRHLPLLRQLLPLLKLLLPLLKLLLPLPTLLLPLRLLHPLPTLPRLPLTLLPPLLLALPQPSNSLQAVAGCKTRYRPESPAPQGRGSFFWGGRFPSPGLVVCGVTGVTLSCNCQPGCSLCWAGDGDFLGGPLQGKA